MRRAKRRAGGKCLKSSTGNRGLLGAFVGGLVGVGGGMLLKRAFPLVHAPGLTSDHDPIVLGLVGASAGAYVGARKPQCKLARR